MASRLVIGTRGSPLALWQANWAKETLETHHPGLQVEIEVIRTTGDRLARVPLAQIGGKEVWTKEIEEALLNGQIDLAVHSLKDLPTVLPRGLLLGAISPREEVQDALVALEGGDLESLKKGARIGTGSLRRQAQLRWLRPDLQVEGIRGNVETRLRKLETEGLDGIILASAGLHRLGLGGRITEVLDEGRMLPAPGQGALGIEIREGDERVQVSVDVLNDLETQQAITAEREMLQVLGGGCRVPIGGWSRLEHGVLTLDGMVASTDGKRLLRTCLGESGLPPEKLGEKVALALKERGADDILLELAD